MIRDAAVETLTAFLLGKMPDINDVLQYLSDFMLIPENSAFLLIVIGFDNPETNQVYNQNVMGDRVIYSQEELLFNFRLIMLLDKEYEPDEDVRINKAFRHMGEDPADEARFDSYVRGGVDVLYEKLIEGVSSPDEYVMRLYDFVEEFQEKFNEEMSSEDILKLCSK